MRQKTFEGLLLRTIAGIVLSATLVLTAFVLFFNSLIQQFVETTDQQRRDNLEQMVTLAHNAIEPILAQVRDGELDKEQGLTQVRNLVRRMTYSDQYGRNYIFMSAYDGTMLVQPYEPAKEMTNQLLLKDDRGNFIIQELIAAAQSAQGYGVVTYYYPPPNSQEAEEKMAYVIGIPELECYLGTGMYMQQAQKHQRHLLALARALSVGLVILLLIPIFISVRQLYLHNRALLHQVQTREKAQAALRESEASFRAIFNGVNDALILHNAQTGQIINVNSRACEMFGLTPEEFKVNDVGAISSNTAPYTQTEAMEWMRKAIEEGPQIYEWHCRRKDGQLFWVEVNIRLATINSAPGLLVTARDITERRRAQAERQLLQSQLQQAQKLESVGRLAGGVAHDFNNILTAILGYSDICLTMEDNLSPHVREALEEITKAGERAQQLTSQLLAFGRKQVLEMMVINPNQIIQDFSRMMRRLIGDDIQIHLKLDPGVSNIRIDVPLFEQVLMNLAVNARDAMPQGGTLTITSANQDLASPQNGSHTQIPTGPYVMISVNDTGVGMPPEVQSQIFEPFYTTKPQGKGTGLGLATVYGIIQQHNGYIHVKSQKGQGTTFEIYVPVCQQNPTVLMTSHSESSLPERGMETILVVDDDDGVRHLLKGSLASLGYTVHVASDFAQAQAVMEQTQGKIDLLVTDVIMPQMNGRQVSQHLTQQCPSLRTLFISGYTENIIGRHGVLEEGLHFLPKPFTLLTLSRKIRQVLEESTSRA